MSKPVTGSEVLHYQSTGCANASCRAKQEWEVNEGGYDQWVTRSSPDHHQRSDHSEPEAVGLGQDLVSRGTEQGSQGRRRVRGEVEIALAIL